MLFLSSTGGPYNSYYDSDEDYEDDDEDDDDLDYFGTCTHQSSNARQHLSPEVKKKLCLFPSECVRAS